MTQDEYERLHDLIKKNRQHYQRENKELKEQIKELKKEIDELKREMWLKEHLKLMSYEY